MFVSTEQIDADIASATEALANASAGIDKMRKELKSLADKVAKSEVRDPFTPPSKLYSALTSFHPARCKNRDDRLSTVRQSAGCRRSAQR
jgi:hypothetical protein